MEVWFTLKIMLTVLLCIWDKVFKNGPSKVCVRQSLKNLKGYGPLSLQNFWRLSSTNFTRSYVEGRKLGNSSLIVTFIASQKMEDRSWPYHGLNFQTVSSFSEKESFKP